MLPTGEMSSRPFAVTVMSPYEGTRVSDAIRDHDAAGHALDLVDAEERDRPASIGECERLAHLGHGVGEGDVAVRHVENVAVVRLKIGNEQIAVAAGFSDRLVTRKPADTLDARNLDQRETVLDGARRVDPAANPDDGARGAERRARLASDGFLPELVPPISPLQLGHAGRDAGITTLCVHLVAVSFARRQGALCVYGDSVAAQVTHMCYGCRATTEQYRDADIRLSAASSFVPDRCHTAREIDVARKVHRREEARP